LAATLHLHLVAELLTVATTLVLHCCRSRPANILAAMAVALATAVIMEAACNIPKI
jgi:hypothetical protein